MVKLNTIDIFSGTKSFSKVANKLGHDTFTIDNESKLNPCQCVDFLQLPIIDFINEKWDIAWFSPPCTTFSVASISTHWYRGYIPKTKEVLIGIQLIKRTIEWISKVKPKIWFIENPRGMLRKIIDDIFEEYHIKDYRRVTITYCQYGDSRMKPTDIWTNNKSWIPKPMCKNGDKCHIAAPRGSRSGTQGLKGAKERGVIPEALFYEIFEQITKDGK